MVDKSGFKKTEIGFVPSDWEIKAIGNLSKVTAGGTPSTLMSEYWDGDIRWMNSGELNQKRVFEVENRITKLGLLNSATKLIPANCVLIGLAGQGKTRGTVAMNMVELCTNQSIAAIHPDGNINQEYLYHNLDSRYVELRGLSTGDGGRGGLNLTIIKKLSIAIPSKNEQALISETLSNMDALINQTEKLIGKKKAIKQGVMQELLKPKDGWAIKRLGDLVDKVSTGKLDANAMKPDGEYRFYTCAKEYFYIDRYAFDDEALLISGNGANVGYIHYYNGKFNAYQRTYVLIGFQIDVFFLKIYLDRYLADRITTEVSAGNTPYIKMDTITEMVVQYPLALKEQSAISSQLNDIEKEIQIIETKLQKLKHQKQGMMQALLTGKIRLI